MSIDLEKYQKQCNEAIDFAPWEVQTLLDEIKSLRVSSPTDQPDGWTLVPNLITLEMQHAYFEIVDRNLGDFEWSLRHGRYDNQKMAYAAMLGASPTPPEREVVDLALIDNAITKLTKAAANLVNGEGFSSSYAEDHRPTTPKWVIDCFVRDDAKRANLGQEVAQGIGWIRNATAKLRELRRRG